jgi:RHH-type transcriptional regulator, proline utilization regulon repressor / proline dehydrogenase / delta 1-pyrroline-5-carboxylate dehydrogenase
MTASKPFNWDTLDRGKFAFEGDVVQGLLAQNPLTQSASTAIKLKAIDLVRATRQSAKKQGVVEGFLKEFSLGTREGLALMCLAEALLRTPDAPTRDRLIAEKIGSADWAAHLGKSDQLFINASTWGLMLTGKFVDISDDAKNDAAGYLVKLTTKLGEPVLRQAVIAAVKIMGEQFVLGRDIDQALKRAAKEKVLCSFDMLGEGAKTAQDASRYGDIYAAAITAVGENTKRAGPEFGHGVSVKLSALCPRYEATQEARVWEELYPQLKRLALIAAHYDLNFAIDAEEADRLVLSLKLIERLAFEPELGDWQGLGVVVQAYQKRGVAVIGGLADLAKRAGRRIMVRLVKGAYWDSEIKRSQIAGYPDYPVFTTKAATDLSYLVCAKALIDASPALFPQFATHNAHTLVAVGHMAQEAGIRIEYQRLHGMGEALYAAADPGIVRAYAPVGGHEELLPYLVRRLLENGANSSFVHVLLDETVPPEAVVVDPIGLVEATPGQHRKIPLPQHLYGETRLNPLGRDISQLATRAFAQSKIDAIRAGKLKSGPIVGGTMRTGTASLIHAPSDRNVILGEVTQADQDDIDRAAALAVKSQPAWDRLGGVGRAPILSAMGDALAAQTDELVALLQWEAGKTFGDAVAEVREAVDFCRYYASLAQSQFGAPTTLRGPVGEANQWQLFGRGVFACISPWNFPLAIFTGQIAAALAAGNVVLAKPAEQTPLIAARALELFIKAGLNPDLLALLPGEGATVGAALVAHPSVNGVAFTGGTTTAFAINRALAARNGPIVPFIAETGGLNAMFVDTTALKEQVIEDVLQSAFGSAGQRCSALRMLYLPADSAGEIMDGLKGALATLVCGDPLDPATDIGPVIDEDALAMLMAHKAKLDKEAKIIAIGNLVPDQGHYFAPIIAQVPKPDYLEHEVFGPILHVYVYAQGELPEVCTRLAARGYGLTLGIHSRIQRFADEVQAMVPAGNIYVNRSMVGAVVGVQPFGGVGLSGTGPKAGGPHALLRYANERAISVNIMAQGGDPALFDL